MLMLSEASMVAIILGAMTLIGTVITAYLSHGAKREAAGANAAVNNVLPGTAPLSERVSAIEATQAEHGSLLVQILSVLTDPRR
jgi:hypothetical protein